MTIDELVTIANMAGVDKPLDVPHLDALFQEAPSAIYYRFIFHLIQYMQPSLAVELGIWYGRCTAHMAAAQKNCRVVAVDCSIMAEAVENTKPYANVELIAGRSTQPELLCRFDDKSIDLLFIDTTHDFDQVTTELRTWHGKIKPGGVVLIDDISENQSMVRAWDAIKDMFPNSVSLPHLHHSGFGAIII